MGMGSADILKSVGHAAPMLLPSILTLATITLIQE